MTVAISDPAHPIHRRREVWVSRANLPQRGGAFTFTWDRVADPIRETCQGWVAMVARGEIGPGLLLHGRPGHGKTSAAALALHGCLMAGTDKVYGRVPGHVPTRPGYFTSYSEFMRTYKKSWEDGEEAQEAGRLIEDMFFSSTNTWERAKILALDDVGKEHAGSTGFNQHVLHDLLRSRWDKGALTIMTTNLHPDKFGDVYGDAMGSFIYEGFLWLDFGAQRDMRRASAR